MMCRRANCLSFGLGEDYVIPHRQPTGAAARAGAQKGQSIEDELSADIDPEAVVEAPRCWESRVEGGRCGRSLQLDPRLLLFLELFMRLEHDCGVACLPQENIHIYGPSPAPTFVISELDTRLQG